MYKRREFFKLKTFGLWFEVDQFLSFVVHHQRLPEKVDAIQQKTFLAFPAQSCDLFTPGDEFQNGSFIAPGAKSAAYPANEPGFKLLVSRIFLKEMKRLGIVTVRLVSYGIGFLFVAVFIFDKGVQQYLLRLKVENATSGNVT